MLSGAGKQGSTLRADNAGWAGVDHLEKYVKLINSGSTSGISCHRGGLKSTQLRASKEQPVTGAIIQLLIVYIIRETSKES